MDKPEALYVLTNLLQHWEYFKKFECDSCIPDDNVEALKVAINELKKSLRKENENNG